MKDEDFCWECKNDEQAKCLPGKSCIVYGMKSDDVIQIREISKQFYEFTKII